MGRRQPQHPPPPAAHAAAGGEVMAAMQHAAAATHHHHHAHAHGQGLHHAQQHPHPHHHNPTYHQTTAAAASVSSTSSGTRNSSRRTSGAAGSVGKTHFTTSHMPSPPTIPSASGGGMVLGHGATIGLPLEEMERSFWELMFTRHERLRPLLEEIRVSPAARARQLARIHCAQLFNDLVFVGLNHFSVVGFHRAERLQAFLEEMETRQTQAQASTGGYTAAAIGLGLEEMEAYMRDFRPDFLRYLRVPSRAAAEAEYLLLAADGQEKNLELHTQVCRDCYVSHMTGGMPMQMGGLKATSDVQELYLRLTEMLPQAKPTEVVMRLLFRDREEAVTEIMLEGNWNGGQGRYEWNCVPLTADTYVDPVGLQPAERMYHPQVGELGMFLFTTEVTMCTKGCLHSYPVLSQGGAAAAAAAAPSGADANAAILAQQHGQPMAPHELLPHADHSHTHTHTHTDMHSPFAPLPPASAGRANNKANRRNTTTTTNKRTSATRGGGGKTTTTFTTPTSSGLPFLEIEPGPVHFAGGGGGKSGKSKPTKRYTCCAPGCSQSATFKPADEPRSKNNMVCVKHACRGMSCIKGPLCDHEECVHEGISSVPRRATFGFPGEKQRRCGKHKAEGMLYATELVKGRDGSAPVPAKRASGGGRKTGASAAAASAAAVSVAAASSVGGAGGHYDEEEEENALDLGLGGGGEDEVGDPVYIPRATKRLRGAAVMHASGAHAHTHTQSKVSATDMTEDHQEDGSSSVFSSGLAAAAAAAAAAAGGGGGDGLTLAGADEEEEQQQQQPLDDHEPASFGDERPMHPHQPHHLHFPSSTTSAAGGNHHQHSHTGFPPASNNPFHGAGPPSSNLEGGPHSFSDLGSNALLVALGEQAGEAFRTFFSKGPGAAAAEAFAPGPPLGSAHVNAHAHAQAQAQQQQFQSMQPSPATAAAAAAIAAATLPEEEREQQMALQAQMLAQVQASSSSSSSAHGQQQQQQQPPFASSYPHQQEQYQSTHAHTHTQQEGQEGGQQQQQQQTSPSNGSSQPMRFDLLIEAASAAKKQKPSITTSAEDIFSREMAAMQHTHTHTHTHPSSSTTSLHLQQHQQQLPPAPNSLEAAGGWAELGSPTLGLLSVGGMDDSFARLAGPTSTTPGGVGGRSMSMLHSTAAVAPAAGATAAGHTHTHTTEEADAFGGGADVDGSEEEDGREGLSVWADDIAAVMITLPVDGTVVPGFGPEDEGIYYIKCAKRWTPPSPSPSSPSPSKAVVKQEEGEETTPTPTHTHTPKQGLMRELVRNPDHIAYMPGYGPFQQVSTLEGGQMNGTLTPGQALVVLDEHTRPLGLAQESYLLEDTTHNHTPTPTSSTATTHTAGRRRAAQKLFLGWSPAGTMQITFEHRPTHPHTMSETTAALVLTPILSTGPWLENTLTDFASRGLTLCTGDLMALLQGAVRVRRDNAIHNEGLRDAETIYDPEEACVPGQELPIDVLEGPLTSYIHTHAQTETETETRSAYEIAAFFLAGHCDAEGRPCFTAAGFVLFVNCFFFGAGGGGTHTDTQKQTDPFATALKVWTELSTMPVDFIRVSLEGTSELIAPISPTRRGQRCFLRLSDLEPQRLVLDWYVPDDEASAAAYGMEGQWGAVTPRGGVSGGSGGVGEGKPKGLLVRWRERDVLIHTPTQTETETETEGVKSESESENIGSSSLVWEVEEPQLQAMLVEHAQVLGLDSTSLVGLVTAAQELSSGGCSISMGVGGSEKGAAFVDLLVATGRRQEGRRYIGRGVR